MTLLLNVIKLLSSASLALNFMRCLQPLAGLSTAGSRLLGRFY